VAVISILTQTIIGGEIIMRDNPTAEGTGEAFAALYDEPSRLLRQEIQGESKAEFGALGWGKANA
jgi:hypothetical protein